MAALPAGQPVPPNDYYFRGATFFETGVARYAWIMKFVIACAGAREQAKVNLKFYSVL